MPGNRENPLITKFRMLCPGISQNTKHHHLTLYKYKGQVWGEKSFLQLCHNNVLSIAFNPRELYSEYDYMDWAHRETKYTDIDNMMENGELYVPPVPRSKGFIREQTKIPWDGEILRSFAELTHIRHITLHPSEDANLKDITYHIRVGSLKCFVDNNYDQCIHHSYAPLYIWTKGGFKILL